jgi:type VI secretion system protein ImpH
MARDPLPAPAERMALFQAIRILERDARATGRAGRLGEAPRPSDEPLRLRTRPGTAFPAGDIAGHRPRQGDAPPELVINVIGLFGPMGALPQAYTDLISTRLRAHDTSLAGFLDLFNHRVGALFYRAWAKYRLPIAHERAPEGQGDPISRLMFALVGFGDAKVRARAGIPDRALLHYGGLFARRVRHADGLGRLLSDYFGRRIGVEQFAGRWLHLAPEEYTRLGAANAGLGRDAIAGPKIWDVQGAFRLKVGPVSYEEFTEFMPGGAGLARLGALARLYVGPGFTFDVEVVLDRREVPGVKLGQTGPAAPRLGWNSWIASEPPRAHPRDAVFRAGETEETVP